MVDSLKKIIIECPECRQKLRVPLFKTKSLKITCQRCRTEFSFDCKKYRRSQFVWQGILGALCITALVANVSLPFVLKQSLDEKLKVIENDYLEKLNQSKNSFSKELEALKSTKDSELQALDSDSNRAKLQEEASNHYSQIWKARSDYDSRYAISTREKAQLEMKALSKDRTKTIEQIIKGIAVKATPDNSSINIYHSSDGIRLDIDFDMSELSSGEEGSRTKHDTIESLKKEVVKLVSRVTNDVFQFCRDLDLKSIAIGCRHYVNVYYDHSNYYSNSMKHSSKDNTILYKVRLDKKDIKELKGNPFLKVYSTTDYLQVEQNEFPNLTVSHEK